MKLSVSISLTPETEDEKKVAGAYQNVNYNLNGFGLEANLSDLNDLVYAWLKKIGRNK